VITEKQRAQRAVNCNYNYLTFNQSINQSISQSVSQLVSQSLYYRAQKKLTRQLANLVYRA